MGWRLGIESSLFAPDYRKQEGDEHNEQRGQICPEVSQTVDDINARIML